MLSFYHRKAVLVGKIAGGPPLFFFFVWGGGGGKRECVCFEGDLPSCWRVFFEGEMVRGAIFLGAIECGSFPRSKHR